MNDQSKIECGYIPTMLLSGSLGLLADYLCKHHRESILGIVVGGAPVALHIGGIPSKYGGTEPGGNTYWWQPTAAIVGEFDLDQPCVRLSARADCGYWPCSAGHKPGRSCLAGPISPYSHSLRVTPEEAVKLFGRSGHTTRGGDINPTYWNALDAGAGITQT